MRFLSSPWHCTYTISTLRPITDQSEHIAVAAIVPSKQSNGSNSLPHTPTLDECQGSAAISWLYQRESKLVLSNCGEIFCKCGSPTILLGLVVFSRKMHLILCIHCILFTLNRVKNIARIANAVQVTLWLSVNYLNRCLCSHCSLCSQCLLLSTSVY